MYKVENKTRARCQVAKKAMKAKLTNTLRREERKKRKKGQICKVK